MAVTIAHVKKDSAQWAIVASDRHEAAGALEDFLQRSDVGGSLKQHQYAQLTSLHDHVDSIEIWGYTLSIVEVATPLEVTSYGEL